MDIDRNAPISASGSVEIAASPLDVWEILADIASWPSWNPDVREARLDGELAIGTAFMWRAGPGTITSVLRSVEPGREIGWTGKTMGIDAVHVWRIQSTPGGSRLTAEESWSGWPTRLMRTRMERTLREAVLSGLYNLKAEAESRARKDLRPAV
jgi:uncharacterized protein YndB with AHSA1/START domain